MKELNGEGKFVVIDGNDGSGKGTQTQLLQEYLEHKQIPHESFDFPQYNTFHGQMVGRFLSGEFGSLETVSPYLITYAYAADRQTAAPKILHALQEGKIVVANRYVSSNLAHQSSRLPEDQQDQFIEWNQKFEYKENGIPKEDLLLYLFVPHSKAQELMQNPDRENREYAQGQQIDLVEGDAQYLSNSEKAYLRLSEKYDHWVKLVCVDAAGNMRSREEIHEEIKKILEERGILPVK